MSPQFGFGMLEVADLMFGLVSIWFYPPPLAPHLVSIVWYPWATGGIVPMNTVSVVAHSWGCSLLSLPTPPTHTHHQPVSCVCCDQTGGVLTGSSPSHQVIAGVSLLQFPMWIRLGWKWICLHWFPAITVQGLFWGLFLFFKSTGYTWGEKSPQQMQW